MLKHLAIRNPDLPHPDPKYAGRGRIGAWNTVMLTACGILTKPDEPRDLTCRVDMVTCPACKLWAAADNNQDKLEDDAQGHRVVA